MTRVVALGVLWVGIAACGDREASESPPEPVAPPSPPLNVDDPEACAGCHQEVVAEWRESMHASAHHDADPVYAAMRRFRMGREGDELAQRCANCHGPRDPQNPDSEVARVGVSCATCHMLDGVGEGRGAQALSFADGVMRGPHDASPSAGAPHGVGEAAPWLTDGRTICLTCHGEMRNPQGVPTCTTGTEIEAEARCTSCHMPEVEGASGAVSSRGTHRSHAFLGPHHAFRGDPSFLASGVELAGALGEEGLRVTVRNLTQHGMPSGFPGRMVLVKVVGFDDEGERAWESFEANPMAEDPQAVFGKVYVDEAGDPTMPPYAARLARDSRLEAGETRTLTWEVPATVVRAEVVLLYRLLPPPAAETLGIADSPEAAPRRFAELEIRRAD